MISTASGLQLGAGLKEKIKTDSVLTKLRNCILEIRMRKEIRIKQVRVQGKSRYKNLTSTSVLRKVGPWQRTELAQGRGEEKDRPSFANWLYHKYAMVFYQLHQVKEKLVILILNLEHFDREELMYGLRALILAEEFMYDRLYAFFDFKATGSLSFHDLEEGYEIIEKVEFANKVELFFEMADTERQGEVGEEEICLLFERVYNSGKIRDLLAPHANLVISTLKDQVA
jgi:hypothetical protein